jgi:hypothetical protein
MFEFRRTKHIEVLSRENTSEHLTVTKLGRTSDMFEFRRGSRKMSELLTTTTTSLSSFRVVDVKPASDAAAPALCIRSDGSVWHSRRRRIGGDGGRHPRG